VKDLLVNVCYGTAKSAEIVSRDMRISTRQHADCAGGRGGVAFPFIYLIGCAGGGVMEGRSGGTRVYSFEECIVYHNLSRMPYANK